MTNCAPSLALALLLHATASPPAAFQEALLQPYAGYCAHPPLAQQGAIAGPLADEVLSRAHIHLVGVQVVFRHGARDLSSDRACFATMEAVFRNCSVQQLVSFETGEKEKEETPALLRKMMDAYPSMEENMPGSGYISQAVGCGKGVLLNDAIPQTIALAHSIEQKYSAHCHRPRVLTQSECTPQARNEPRPPSSCCKSISSGTNLPRPAHFIPVLSQAIHGT